MVMSKDDARDSARERYSDDFKKLEETIDHHIDGTDPDELTEHTAIHLYYDEDVPMTVVRQIEEAYREAGWYFHMGKGMDSDEWEITIY